ncbi:hypothetical protein LPB86_02500 [Pedobacter sp. MC2016-14]|uniref:hypothetical protein n=1 Tax=Pedobacter sp. MC2016-14 TaxID=2897327 RepID=UPI001E31FB2E|nr:hypothetical protein [Pedobacter sp. MC2016-14]MCD0487082.1 hypothetical protein [Pedobacter sp. MC2016-14]
MYRIYLTIVVLFCGNFAFAQNNFLSLEESAAGSGAITIAVSGLDEEDGNNYFSEADKNEKRGDLNDALTLFGKAAFEYNSSKKFALYGSALMRLSHVHFLMEHYTEAEQVVLNVALKNYSKIGSRNGQMNAYSQLGKIYFASNKLTQSLWFYTQQGILAQQLKDYTSYIASLLGIMNVKIKRKEYKLATKDINRIELLAKNSNINQFKREIRDARSLISGKQSFKK